MAIQNSKVKKLQEDCLAIFKADGFIRMQRRMVPLSAGTNGE